MSERPPSDAAERSQTFRPLPEIDDPRTSEQLKADHERARAQRIALEADHDARGGVNDILRELVRRRNEAAATTPSVRPVGRVTFGGDADGSGFNPNGPGGNPDGGDPGNPDGPGGGNPDGDQPETVLMIPDQLIAPWADLEARTTAPGTKFPAGRDAVPPPGPPNGSPDDTANDTEDDAPDGTSGGSTDDVSADDASADSAAQAAPRPRPRPSYPPDVTAVLRELGYRPAEEVDPNNRRSQLVARFVRVPRPDDPPLSDPDRVRRTLEHARILRERTGLHFGVEYVTTLGQIIKGSDHAHPSSSRGLIAPPVVREFIGSKPVRVAVIDTGITKERRRDLWLAGVPRTLPSFPVIDTVYSQVDPKRIDYGGGHGGFVAGIVEQVSPGSDIACYQAVGPDGFGTEVDVAEAIFQAAKDGAVVINVSLGVNTVDDEPPVALRAAVEAVSRLFPNTLLVASAGNQGEARPMYPAAFKPVIAVGALRDDGSPTSWSNRGFWLDCSTVGVGITSTFVPGVLPTIPNPADPDVTFGPDPWALWTGTSFAAPQITGAVARIVQLSGGAMTARQAFEWLMRGRPTLPGFGHTLRILPGTPD